MTLLKGGLCPNHNHNHNPYSLVHFRDESQFNLHEKVTASSALLCTVTKPRHWKVRLLLMRLLPVLWLTVAECGYLVNPTIETTV